METDSAILLTDTPAPVSRDLITREVSRRRTFAIISHPDAGKTTLTEKLLLFSGAIQLAGTVKGRKSGRHATSDWMDIEKQRGISVASSVMQFEYRNHVVNLLDTPGHQDFSEDTYRVLTAVDSALMVIDAAKGVETQTIKLLNVCRMRNTPIITFINKMDRETRDPVELLDEVESVLNIQCAPVTWPLGMGKSFRGVYHLLRDEILLFAPGEERADQDFEVVKGINNPRLAEMFPQEIEQLKTEVELLHGASHPFDLAAFLAGTQTPVFFGSAINNFGVREILNALLDWAPAPLARDATVRTVEPTEPSFSGFVFKIQANMDANHRDRIAFLRVCSGRFERGMKIKHLRINREIRVSNVVTFMAASREQVEEAYAGDIIGLPNHGNMQIGDSFSEGELLQFTGIPYFAHAKIVDGGTKEYRRLRACQECRQIEWMRCTVQKFDFRLELLDFLREHFRQARIVDAFHHFKILIGAFLARRKQQNFIAQQVIHAAKRFTHAQRPGHRRALDVEHRLDFVQQLHRVARLAVHFIDEGNDGRVAHAAHVEQLDGLRLHTLGRVYDHQGGIHSSQHTIGILGKILVAGGIEQVDHVVAILELHDRAGYRYAALLLDVHPVGSGVATALAPFDRTSQLNRAGE